MLCALVSDFLEAHFQFNIITRVVYSQIYCSLPATNNDSLRYSGRRMEMGNTRKDVDDDMVMILYEGPLALNVSYS